MDDKKETSGPLSHAALVASANAACRSADAPEPAVGTTVAFDRLGQLTRLYRQDAARARGVRAELGRLRARPQDRSRLRAVRKSLRDIAVLNDKVGQIRSAPELGVLGPFAVAANRVAFERAAALGARLCPPLSASPAYNAAVKDNRRRGKPVPPPRSQRISENARNKSDPVRPEAKPVASANERPGETKLRKVGITVRTPRGWRRKQIDGPNAEAFGDDVSDCGFHSDRDAPPGSGSQAALYDYAQAQVAYAKKKADGYRLVALETQRAQNATGVAIVRSSRKGSQRYAGRVAFFFTRGRRYVVDCYTNDPKRLAGLDKRTFEPVARSVHISDRGH